MQWRTLQDASDEVLIQHGNANLWPDGRRQSWPDWQLGVIDAYSQGELVWLDIDTLIRERSGGRKSLDDFARGFFGIRDGSPVAAPYTFGDLVARLNAVLPYDWETFLRARVDSVAATADLDGIARGIAYSAEVLKTAIVATSDGGKLDLQVARGATTQELSVAWSGGPRYPHLERVPGSAALLDDILAPRQ